MSKKGEKEIRQPGEYPIDYVQARDWCVWETLTLGAGRLATGRKTQGLGETSGKKELVPHDRIKSLANKEDTPEERGGRCGEEYRLSNEERTKDPCAQHLESSKERPPDGG